MSTQVNNLLHPLRAVSRWWRGEHARVRALHENGLMTIDHLADLDGATHQPVPAWRRLQSLY